jgi:hypothetical protein
MFLYIIRYNASTSNLKSRAKTVEHLALRGLPELSRRALDSRPWRDRAETRGRLVFFNIWCLPYPSSLNLLVKSFTNSLNPRLPNPLVKSFTDFCFFLYRLSQTIQKETTQKRLLLQAGARSEAQAELYSFSFFYFFSFYFLSFPFLLFPFML